jgi:hypothetical protein
MPYPELPESNPARDVVVGGALGALGGVPVVGGSIAGVIQAGIAARARQMDEEFFAFLSARVSALEQRVEGFRFDPDDPAFVAAVHRAQRMARETVDDDKRRLLADAAVMSGSWSSFSLDEREEFFEQLSSLSPWQVRVLTFFSDPSSWLQSHGKNVPAIQRKYMTIWQMLHEQVAESDGPLSARIQRAVEDLNSQGLTDVPLQTVMTAGGPLQPRLTPRGVRLMSFLNTDIARISP